MGLTPCLPPKCVGMPRLRGSGASWRRSAQCQLEAGLRKDLRLRDLQMAELNLGRETKPTRA